MKRTLGALVVVAAVLGSSACSTNTGPEDEALAGAEEIGGSSDGLSEGVPVGSILVTTAAVNLRTSASTSASVRRVIPNGARVTTVNQSTPVNGWYNVSHDGLTGWTYGAYLKLVSTGGGSTGGGSGGGGSTDARSLGIERAKTGVGFSYWWGHGKWLTSGATSSNKGTCTGSCPSCSHAGTYGADCSGFVAKVWQVPSSNTNLGTDAHPYSTSNFARESHGWHDVTRGQIQKGDALVYNTKGKGHILVFESGDAWGSLYSYEARGCSYGIVHNLRTVTSSYKAIGRDGW